MKIKLDSLFFTYSCLLLGFVIKRGLKLKAFKFFLEIKSFVKKALKIDFYFVFLVSILKISPKFIFSFIRLGTIRQGVPLPITEKKSTIYAFKWLNSCSKSLHKKKFLKPKNISLLLVLTFQNKGACIKKKKEIYKIALENRHLLRLFK